MLGRAVGSASLPRKSFRHNSSSWPSPRLRPRCVPCQQQLRTHAVAVTNEPTEQDRDRELGRSFRRAVFDQQQWEEHRSAKRYARHFFGILTSRIVRGLLGPCVYVGSLCFSVCTYHTLLDMHALQWLAPDLDWPTINLSSAGIFSLSTFALSLLLVFRTNSSYERWWEARDCWRTIVNEVTHLARQVEQWLPGPERAPLRSALLRWLRVFPLSLMVHLRGHEEDLAGLADKLLQPQESALLLKAPSPPQLVLSAVGQLLAASDARIESKTHCDESVRVLQEAVGGCEKLLTTPLPLSYTRHTGRFLVLWCTCFPFVSWQELGWLSVPTSMVVTFLLFGIEEIGVQIEEPFGILALEHYCDEADAGISQASADAEALAPLTAALLPPGYGTHTTAAEAGPELLQHTPAVPAHVVQNVGSTVGHAGH